MLLFLQGVVYANSGRELRRDRKDEDPSEYAINKEFYCSTVTIFHERTNRSIDDVNHKNKRRKNAKESS